MLQTIKEPDIVLELKPGAFAPRVARQAVSQVGSPSPDLRDAVALIVSNLVTRACRLTPVAAERIGLRAWMPRSVVRVEVRSERNPFEPDPCHEERWPDYDIDLLEGLADRWGVHCPSGTETIAWFEIDRQAEFLH